MKQKYTNGTQIYEKLIFADEVGSTLKTVNEPTIIMYTKHEKIRNAL